MDLRRLILFLHLEGGSSVPIMERAHCGVNVPRGSRAVGKMAEYPMETHCVEEYTTSMGESHFLWKYICWKVL